jgi:hypothetical protein
MRESSVRQSSDQWYVRRILFFERYVRRRRVIAIEPSRPPSQI